MKSKQEPFDRMVNNLIDIHGLTKEAAIDLVVRSSEDIYNDYERNYYQQILEQCCKSMDLYEARIDACKRLVNKKPIWDAIADEAHRYQMVLRNRYQASSHHSQVTSALSTKV